MNKPEPPRGPLVVSEYGEHLGGKPGKMTLLAESPARVIAENVSPEYANLLAAAPDLLEACERARVALSGGPDVWEQQLLRNAIAKAKGEEQP